jgi:hypothetical protein
MILGDEGCGFDTVPTTAAERHDFNGNADWAHVDPKIDDYLRERRG